LGLKCNQERIDFTGGNVKAQKVEVTRIEEQIADELLKVYGNFVDRSALVRTIRLAIENIAAEAISKRELAKVREEGGYYRDDTRIRGRSDV
jgi:hypothetical protein